MRSTNRFPARATMWVAALAVLAISSASNLAAQSIPAAEADKVMGRWSLTLDGGQGMITLLIEITEVDGQAAAAVGSDLAPQIDKVSRISKVGETVTLFFTTDIQGQVFPVEIALTPSGENLAASVTAADGMFMTEGTAVPAS